MYVFTNTGVVAIQGGVEAVQGMTNVLRQIGDDIAVLASGGDDAAQLLQVAKDALAGNGMETVKAVGAVAFGAAAAAGIVVGAVPVAGAVAISVGFGYGAGKLYEWAFDRAVAVGERAGAAAYELWPPAVSPALGTTPAASDDRSARARRARRRARGAVLRRVPLGHPPGAQ